MLLIASLVVMPVRGGESPTATVREVLHAKLMESLPPFQPPKPQEEKKRIEVPAIFAKPLVVSESAHSSDLELAVVGERQIVKPSEERKPNERSVVMIAPVVVSESRRNRDLEAAIDRQIQKEPFSVVRGGTIYSSDRIKVGGWWTEKQGWSFLKISW